MNLGICFIGRKYAKDSKRQKSGYIASYFEVGLTNIMYYIIFCVDYSTLLETNERCFNSNEKLKRPQKGTNWYLKIKRRLTMMLCGLFVMCGVRTV